MENMKTNAEAGTSPVYLPAAGWFTTVLGRDLLLSCDDAGESGDLLIRGNEDRIRAFTRFPNALNCHEGFLSQGGRFSLPQRL